MYERFIATVDLGSSKIALAIAKITGETTEVIYYRERPSAGIYKGGILNPTKAGIPLKEAIEEAEKDLHINIRQVVVNLPQSAVRQESRPAGIDREEPSSCITKAEVEGLMNATLEGYPLEDPKREMIYRTIAQSFSTDDMIRAKEDDIIGMPSKNLHCNFKVFIGARKQVDNIDTAFSQINVKVAEKYFIPEIIADSVLSADEKENGVGIVDFGGGVTSLSIYHGGLLRFYNAIPFGGKSVTYDIKYEGGFNEALAENIKYAFGACQPDKLQNMSDKILKILNDEDGIDQELSVKYLSEIISARVFEIYHAILYMLNGSGYSRKLRNGLVLTGGMANLTNCAAYLKELSGMNVRVGYPRIRKFSVTDCAGLGETGAATTVGMILAAKKDQSLNCLDSYYSDFTGILSEETVQETISEQSYQEEEQPEQEWTAAPEPAEEERDKEPAGSHPKSKITWGQSIIQALDRALDGSKIGRLYDEME